METIYAEIIKNIICSTLNEKYHISAISNQNNQNFIIFLLLHQSECCLSFSHHLIIF